MFGTYSTSSIDLPEGSLGRASQIPYTMLCSLNQLNPHKHSQTSSGIALGNVVFDRVDNVVFDRESGKAIVIQYPSFDLMMFGSSLSLRTDSDRLSLDKWMLLLKCLLIVQNLPETALEEASEELEGIYRFHMNRNSQANIPAIPASNVRGKLRSTQVRPPIVLES